MIKNIWTIGHSTLDWPAFLGLLQSYGLRTLVDVRASLPAHRDSPFTPEAMTAGLSQAGIRYIKMPDLGGRRVPSANSINTALESPALRGYADHMKTPVFKHALAMLEELAATQFTVYMCTEVAWALCHRGLISDALKAKGWEVLHITASGTESHPYNRAARVEGGQLSYSQERFL
jgi:uncharacterized protein (DUF488 family)